jgi:serine/threonine protein kinase
MRGFLLCCFQKDPDERSSSTELLNHEWLLKYQRKPKSATMTTDNNAVIKKRQQHPNGNKMMIYRLICL